MKILIVDDDRDLTQALGLGLKLQWPGCHVVTAASGQEALLETKREGPDIILLDIALPGMNGLEVLRLIREFSDVPVIMLTVRGEELDKVQALELGADDYVTKPFGALELMARVKAVLRRAFAPLPDAAVRPVTVGDLTIEYGSSEVAVCGRRVRLTPSEHRLLCTLARHCNQVLPHRTLLARVWGEEYEGESGFLKVYIKRLRDKIEEDPANPRYILTEWGRGYKLAVPE